MAITLTANQPEQKGFEINGVSADLTGCETLNAAVTGKSHYLESVTISTDTDMSVTIGEGETTNAVTTPRYGPIFVKAYVPHSMIFREALKLTAATDLTVDSSASGNATIFVEGETY